MQLETTTKAPLSEAMLLSNWRDVNLPDTWADKLNWWQLGGYLALFRVLLWPCRKPVLVPSGVPMSAELPDYIKHEFHAIPNGNYSNSLVGPYVEAFERSMLGRMRAVRSWVASRLAGLESVLEVGCGGGKLAAAIRAAGVPDVWGVDASPYMLQYAARTCPQVKFVQGLAEQLAFCNQRFNAACACFLFHELPPRAGDQALSEMRRVIEPGGTLIIIEPGPEQLSSQNPLKLWKLAGWAGLYFGIMARFVYEPFVRAWHARDKAAWLREHGFEPQEEHSSFPVRIYVARRLDSNA